MITTREQDEIFPKGPKGDVKYYWFMWKNNPHECEECGVYLRAYSSAFISHILSRGAYPEMRHDTRNANILCLKHHQQWESEHKASMKIYPNNLLIIQKLRDEYNMKL